MLDVSENYRSNVYSKVLSKVVACQRGVSPDFQNTETVSRGDLQEEFSYKCRTTILKNASQWLLLMATLFHKFS